MNAELRGRISNENQSDIVVRNGPLWIHNTLMELDNITIENGVLSVQDSEAMLRNLQVLGAASSAMRMTRDSLVTTSSNAGTLSSNLEIGNGSLVNVSGSFSNQGAIHLETGGWLTVLKGDDPILPDRLTTPGGIPSIVNIAGDSNFEDSLAALALVSTGDIDPVDMFQNQVKGSRLGTGVLLLSNGEIENQVINNVGGTVITSGGEFRDSEITLSQQGAIVVAHEPVLFINNLVPGTGTIDIQPGGELSLENSDIGDGVSDPETLVINNRGTTHVRFTADFNANTVFVNDGTLELAAEGGSNELKLAVFRQLGGVTELNDSANRIIATQPMEIFAGRVVGTGSIEADLINRGGTISPGSNAGTGDFANIDNFTQLNAGETIINVHNTGGAISRIYAETANLDGRLKVLVNDANVDSIMPGESWEFLFYPGGVSGEFASLDLETYLGQEIPNLEFSVVYGSESASIVWSEVVEIEIGEFPIFDPGFEF